MIGIARRFIRLLRRDPALGIALAAGWFAAAFLVGFTAVRGEIFFLALATLLLAMLALISLALRRLEELRARPRPTTPEEVADILQKQYMQIESLLKIQGRIGALHHLPPTRGWAASPDVLEVLGKNLADAAAACAPRHLVVMECGSGVSTVYIASVLKGLGGGHVFSLDHDASYAQKTKDWLQRAGLSEYGTVIHAPLGRGGWYEAGSLEEIPAVDLLFIDGPPQIDLYTRYPALEMLRRVLRRGAVVILDDGNRNAETSTVKRWLKEGRISSSEYVPCEKGAYIMRYAGLPESNGHEGG